MPARPNVTSTMSKRSSSPWGFPEETLPHAKGGKGREGRSDTKIHRRRRGDKVSETHYPPFCEAKYTNPAAKAALSHRVPLPTSPPLASAPAGLGEQFSCGSNMAGESFAVFGEGAEVALHLESMPEAFRLPKEGTEADRHRGCDRAASEHDLVDRTGWHPDGPCHGILRNPHGFQIFLQEEFSGCYGWTHGYNVSRYRWAVNGNPATSAGPVSVHRKTMRHWLLIRIEWHENGSNFRRRVSQFRSPASGCETSSCPPKLPSRILTVPDLLCRLCCAVLCEDADEGSQGRR